MRNRTEVEIDRGQVSYADPGFFVRLDHQANIPANAGGVVLILNLSVPARQQVSNSRLLAQISQHHVHAAAHRQPIINPVVDGGNKRQAEDGRSLEKVPADPVQVVLQSAAEIVTHGEAEFKPAVQAVNIKEAAGGQRNQRVAAVGSPRRRARARRSRRWRAPRPGCPSRTGRSRRPKPNPAAMSSTARWRARRTRRYCRSARIASWPFILSTPPAPVRVPPAAILPLSETSE